MTNIYIITSKINKDQVKCENEASYASTHKPYTRCQIILTHLINVFDSALGQITYIDEDIDAMHEKLFLLVNEEYLHFLKYAYSSYLEAKVTNINTNTNTNINEYESPYDNGLVNYCFSKKSMKNIGNIPSYLQCGIYGNDYYTFNCTYQAALISAYSGLVIRVIFCLGLFVVHATRWSMYFITIG